MRRTIIVQRFAAVIMLIGSCLAIDALLSHPSHAQETLRDEMQRLGMLPAELANKSQEIALTAQELHQLGDRVKVLEALDVKSRLVLLEDYVHTAKETQRDGQKTFWGVVVMFIGFVGEKIYLAFRRLSKERA